MSDPVIAPDEAFRAILRVRYLPRPALADEIRDWPWFHHPRRRGVPPEENCAATVVLNWLREQPKAGKLRLRGVLDATKPPQDIDPIDVRAGVLDPWKRELRIDGVGGRTDRTYRQVHIIAADIQAAIAPAEQGAPSPAPVASGSVPDARWPIPEQPKSGRRAQLTAWRIMKRVFQAEGGVPRSWSVKRIADHLNQKRFGGDELVTEDSVRRLLRCE
jgi:hypothetical protein